MDLLRMGASFKIEASTGACNAASPTRRSTVSWAIVPEKSLTAAELLVRGLRKRGIDWMATLCGHGLDPLFDAARHGGMRLIDARNEQTAAYIADAYGRLTRR